MSNKLTLPRIINDSLFRVHGVVFTGAQLKTINGDMDLTHDLTVALNEGVYEGEGEWRVELCHRVEFTTFDKRCEAFVARDALKTLETEHPAVYALINQSMSEAHGYLWSRRLDLARESLYLHVLEDQGYAPPEGYTWDETFEAIDDAWDEAHGN
jgi:hypothetical protein